MTTPNENVIVIRELLRQLQGLCMEVRQQSSPRMAALAIPLYDALRTLLDAPAVEPVAEVYLKMTGGNSFPGTGIRMLESAPLLAVGTKLYTAPPPVPVHEPECYTVDAVAWEGFLHVYRKYVDGHAKYPFVSVREAIASVIDSAAPQAQRPRKAVKLTQEDVREVYLANGFTVKAGQLDLKPYVFQAANAIQDAFIAKNGSAK